MSNVRPKNMIVIMSDQHNKHMLGCYGNPVIETPNIDALATRGVRFTDAYCNNPVCVPSRSSMVTGQYSHTHGYWDNAHAYGGGEDSFGTKLHQNGYTVTTIGKMHLRNDSAETGFHDQRIPLHMVNGIGDVYGSIRDKKIARPQFLKALESAGPGETDYTRYDREITRQAREYLLHEAPSKEKPFVLYLGFVSPHFPLTVPQEYFDKYINQSLVKPIQSDPEQWPSHPVLNDYRRYCNMEHVSSEVAQRALATYYGMCTFLDDQIGIVLNALQEAGLEEDTRILYTTDHGDTMGEHGLFFKSTMYEGSVGVPMILAGSDLPQHTVSSALVSLIDLYPTILDSVGLSSFYAEERLPGNSLFEVLIDPSLHNRPVFSEYHAFGSYTSQFMLRLGPYKYIHYMGEPSQLFNLENDPDELHDLCSQSAYAGVLESMEQHLRSIVDPEALAQQAKASQLQLLETYGGEEEFLKGFKPALFSPIPKGV